MKIRTLCVVSALAVSGSAASANADFNYPNFASTAGLTFAGAAAPNAATSSIYLTPNPATFNEAGAVWVTQRQDVALGFNAEMTVRIPAKNGIGADGFALVIQNERRNALGGYAGGMGYGNNPLDSATTGILNGVAIEMDTWSNQRFTDNPGRHFSIQTNGRGAMSPLASNSLANSAMTTDITDGGIYTLRVQYTPGTMNVFFGNSLTPVLTANINLATLLELETVGGTSPGRAWIGVTAANGDAPNSATHELLSLSFTSIPTPSTAALLGLGGLMAARRRRN